MKREAVASIHSILVCCPITLLPLGFLATSGVRFRTRNTWRLLRDETPGTYAAPTPSPPSPTLPYRLGSRTAYRPPRLHTPLLRVGILTIIDRPNHPISRASPRRFRELHASELREAPHGARIRRYHAFVAAEASFARTW
ncbi:hypothetical protein B296_00044570 [Ensete ventricosum]|uniref:Uncharacterized protein n=1 Tax=Ensete ventricosum TaxID=4639 RepID=A0A426X7H3_ENSVE|nr:hypothetical protein B296_00044570 [Ensete ventricosum]